MDHWKVAQNFSGLEQLFLEYVNRARLDPERETLRLLGDSGVTDANLIASLEDLLSSGLNRGLGPDTISGLPLQVLAPNTLLSDAASAHSDWMLSTNFFSHFGQAGSADGDRINAAGYVLTDEAGFAIAPPAAWDENLSWLGNAPGSVDLGLAVITHAAGLFNSDGHRANILSEWFRETAKGQAEGVFTSAGTDWNASMLTQKFTLSGTDVFLAGVVYSDHDGNGFYSPGEGESGITIATTAVSTVSATHGGYALGMSAAPNVEVTLTWGAASIGATVDLTGGNVKLDLVGGADDSLRLLSSVDLILAAGATAAQLIGAGDLTLQANDSGNLLLGNYGNNILTDGAGNDTLAGGEGNDTLVGGGGSTGLCFRAIWPITISQAIKCPGSPQCRICATQSRFWTRMMGSIHSRIFTKSNSPISFLIWQHLAKTAEERQCLQHSVSRVLDSALTTIPTRSPL